MRMLYLKPEAQANATNLDTTKIDCIAIMPNYDAFALSRFIPKRVNSYRIVL